jgi:DNA-binding NtrC family response regulator
MIDTRAYKVLVADDDSDIRDLLTTLLSMKGHICESASDGHEAFEKMAKGQFDAVITDVLMPKKDGMVLAKELLEKDPLLPVMIMTGYLDRYSIKDAMSMGVSDFITKPFHPKDFFLRFERMMHDRDVNVRIQECEKEMVKVNAEMMTHDHAGSEKKMAALQDEIMMLRKQVGH